MTERVTRTSVKFRHAFYVPGIERQQAAGTYDVVTIEQQIEGLSFIAYRRLSTTITHSGTISGMRAEQTSDIDPEDLEDLLAKDREAEHGQV